ncbi:unnamed protein product [Bemisia tabaci]|uniref:Uncharacterized protein n=1 Tax=Bemisia tabaci TaxID=7038 RepID=A0A9P0EVX6_BEMTA|nr:unnamed protein product [Bemisia tabaci]
MAKTSAELPKESDKKGLQVVSTRHYEAPAPTNLNTELGVYKVSKIFEVNKNPRNFLLRANKADEIPSATGQCGAPDIVMKDEKEEEEENEKMRRPRLRKRKKVPR